MARVSNTNPPGVSILWINATKAACLHVSPDAFRPSLLWPPTSSGLGQWIQKAGQTAKSKIDQDGTGGLTFQ